MRGLDNAQRTSMCEGECCLRRRYVRTKERVTESEAKIMKDVSHFLLLPCCHCHRYSVLRHMQRPAWC